MSTYKNEKNPPCIQTPSGNVLGQALPGVRQIEVAMVGPGIAEDSREAYVCCPMAPAPTGERLQGWRWQRQGHAGKERLPTWLAISRVIYFPAPQKTQSSLDSGSHLVQAQAERPPSSQDPLEY